LDGLTTRIVYVAVSPALTVLASARLDRPSVGSTIVTLAGSVSHCPAGQRSATTMPVFVVAPASVATARTVTVTSWPAASAPSSQRTRFPDTVQSPCVESAPRTSRRLGTGSSTTTPSA
jgi:hypothetical protein